MVRRILITGANKGIGLEIARQHADPIEAVFVPIGGGGLAAGVASILKFLRPETRVIGVEPVDAPGEEGLRSRAVIEAREEAGVQVPAEACVMLGGETFASPGTTDEKLYFCAVETPLEDRAEPTGDGSVMEEWSRVHLLDLGEAIAMCRDGRVPDMKTEVALLRLADHLGYVPALDAFAEDLTRR